MIINIEINTLEELLPLITEQKYKESIDRYRSKYVYRGMPDASYHLQTSLYRNCKELKNELEPSILKNFNKYAALEDPTVEHSVWRQMILGQHHGLPTRLLDWSQSVLTAMHFAVTEADLDMMDARDCVIWRLNIEELYKFLPESYRRQLDENNTYIFNVDALQRVAPTLEDFDRDTGGKALAIIEPPSMDSRIISQYAFFSVIPGSMESIEAFLDEYTSHTRRYIINRALRWRIRDMLDQLNISERMYYPGLDGMSKWIGRHYYVKNNILTGGSENE